MCVKFVICKDIITSTFHKVVVKVVIHSHLPIRGAKVTLPFRYSNFIIDSMLWQSESGRSIESSLIEVVRVTPRGFVSSLSVVSQPTPRSYTPPVGNNHPTLISFVLEYTKVITEFLPPFHTL